MAALTVPPAHLTRPSYRLCPDPACPVVYHGAGGAVLERDDVRVPVLWKDAGPDVPLCYCFGHTRRSIDAEIASTGSATAFATIAAAVRAGRCACDVKNPSGACCLGDIARHEKRHATRADACGRADSMTSRR